MGSQRGYRPRVYEIACPRLLLAIVSNFESHSRNYAAGFHETVKHRRKAYPTLTNDAGLFPLDRLDEIGHLKFDILTALRVYNRFHTEFFKEHALAFADARW